MGKTTGFIDYTRKTSTDVPPLERIENFNEFHVWLSREEQQTQAARCMDCGVPFCQAGMMIGGMASGCPLNNLIPEWNDLVYRHDWREVTAEYWDERAATNIRHMFFAIQAVAPDMIEAGGGSIVNMASLSWMMPMGGFPAYATSKAAVHGLTRNMARDLGPHRIRVNTVVPGWIMTERQKELWLTPEAMEAHRDRQCLKDMIEPVYVARMAVFLASDDAAMCTAQNFMVEGGSI